MSNKAIVMLRSAPSESIEVPSVVKYKGDKEKKELKRSCFGAIRLFPGIPKAITTDELEHIKKTRADLFARLEVRPYVESKRVDVRGASEADIEKMAASEGIGHLRPKAQVSKLEERGKLKRPEKRETAAKVEGKSSPTPAPAARRKPKNGNGNGG